jgi:hypothetical protein
MRVRWVLIVLGVCIAALAVLGNNIGRDPAEVWDLGAERNVSAGFSALLLCAAAVMSIAYGYRDRQADGTAKLMGLYLLYMALDEFVAIHERPEDITGIPWPIFWLPVMAVGAVLGIAMLALLPRPADLLWLGAAFCWLCAPLFDVIQEAIAQPGNDVRAGVSTMEELAELTGSTLFIAALLKARQLAGSGAPVRARPAPSSTTPGRTDPQTAATRAPR